MPEWISVWIAKIFGSEPVVKVMYVLIGWCLLILFMPARFTESIYEKSNIPFAGQLCLFALAFVIVDAVQRGMNKWKKHQEKIAMIDEKNKQAQQAKIAIIRDIENLDPIERSFLKHFANSSSAWLSPDNVSVTSLLRKRFISCTHHRRRIKGSLIMSYEINQKYAAVVREYFKEVNKN
ncbi:super-infection exclusion protein B [Yersinia enterocolitica]|uniref:super-infection exclusion protein B n=1 Tax=Yersinia kristensenii TaxID=28152 RepID=UPI0001A546BE|nr:super-infection exclusion protein B [Yersinia kristensenii]EEP92402.1 Superinfection exclusion protein B [Yersinia kristensenii ATCC 33638]PEH52578.1 hypothetical protein CRM81_03970 [Yersinia kristensenii]SUP70415.1 Uncharacterised protein [Yersinia kristensenii]SUQ39298.1 Uncharacterised protein [Yersinia kristensenii]